EDYFQKKFSSYGTHIYFEGVSRIEESLTSLCELYPELDIAVARELTKHFESVYRFKGRELKNILPDIVMKGEFVILIHQEKEGDIGLSSELIEQARTIIETGISTKTLSKLLATITGDRAKNVYQKLQNSPK